MPRIWFNEDDGMPLHECNECGGLVPVWDELCQACGHFYDLRELEDMYA